MLAFFSFCATNLFFIVYFVNMPETKKESGESSQNNSEGKVDVPKATAIGGIIAGIRSAISKVAVFGKDLWGKGTELFNQYILKQEDDTDSSSVDAPPEIASSDPDSSDGTNPDSFTRKYDQWTLDAKPDDYSITNKDSDGSNRFYTMKKGKYGNPVYIDEESRALPIPTGVTVKNTKGEDVTLKDKIAGIICENGPRFSLSNPDAPKFEIKDDGSLTIDDKTWHLHTIFDPDKNRITNYKSYWGETKPANDNKVLYRELGDLELYNNAA